MSAAQAILAETLFWMVVDGGVHDTFGQIETSSIACRLRSVSFVIILVLIGLFSAFVIADRAILTIPSHDRERWLLLY